MKKKMRLRTKLLIVSSVVLVLLLLLNVSVRFNPKDNGGCISVALDKLPMMLANRAVLTVGEERYEISDPSLVHQIALQTVCATNTGLCRGNTDRWIELYWGSIPVRKMQWEDFHDQVVVYYDDGLHWIAGPGETSLANLSDEVKEKLKALCSS